MKSSDKPRKVYLRKGIPYVCFSGKVWAPEQRTVDGTKLDITKAVGAVTMQGTQVLELVVKQGELCETWSLIDFPSHSKKSDDTKKPLPAEAQPVQAGRQIRPRGRTTGKIELDGCEAVAEACKKLGIKWSAEDEKAHRAFLRKRGRFGAAKRGMF